MSRRRISTTRRQSFLRRSSSGPGELDEDSNYFATDDPLWCKRLEGNNTVLLPSLQLSNGGETTGILDSESDSEMASTNPAPSNWWKPLEKLNKSVRKSPDVESTSRRSINTTISAGDSFPNEESLSSEPDKNPRKKKKRLILVSQTAESSGDSAFLNALNQSATTAISDPGPSKRRKSLQKTTFFSDEDSFRRTKNSSRSGKSRIDDETHNIPDQKMRKLRKNIFTKPQDNSTESTDDVFEKILDNVSSSNESLITSDNRERNSTQSFKQKQESVLTNIEEIEPDRESILSTDQLNKSKERSYNQNLNQKHKTVGNRSKTPDNSIPSNSRAKISQPGEQNDDSTSESNSSVVQVRKKRPSLFRRKGKNLVNNFFENALTSTENSTLTESSSRNINNSKVTPVVEASSLGTRLVVKNNSQSESEIDVEEVLALGGNSKSNRENSLKSTSKRKRKSAEATQIGIDSGETIHNSPNLVKNLSERVVNSYGKELISIGTSNDESGLSASENQNASPHKSKMTSQNVEHSRRSSRLNMSANGLEKQSTSIRLSIVDELPQYESTRKIDIQKSIKSQGERESRRFSKVDNTKNNKDRSENVRKNQSSAKVSAAEFTTENSTLKRSKHVSARRTINEEEEESRSESKNISSGGELTSIKLSVTPDRSKNASGRKFADEEESDSEIEVNDSNFDNITKDKSNASNLGEVSPHSGRRDTESRRVSKNVSSVKELTSKKLSVTSNRSKNASGRKIADGEESNSEIEINDPKVDNSAKNESNASNLGKMSQSDLTWKLNSQKSDKNRRETESRRESRNISSVGELTSKKFSVTSNRSKNVFGRKFVDEEESESEIEVNDPDVDNNIKDKSNVYNLKEVSRESRRKEVGEESATINESGRRTSDGEESNSDIEFSDPIPKVDNGFKNKNNTTRKSSVSPSQSKNASSVEESTSKKLSVTSNQSRNASGRRTVNESDSDIEISNSNSEVGKSLKNKANTLNSEETKGKSMEDGRSMEINKMNEPSSENIANSENQVSDSERSLTISLSEGHGEESSKIHDRTTERSFERSQGNNSLTSKSRKPTIINYEVLKPNDIDLEKLKGNDRVLQTGNGIATDLHLEGMNTPRISRSSGIRDISASATLKRSMIPMKDTHLSTVEEELSRLHGEEMPSTSRGHSQVSKNSSLPDVNGRKSKEVSKSKTSGGEFESTLADDDESEVSENPLLTYVGTEGEAESDYELDNSTQKQQLEDSHPIETYDRGSKRKTILDHFKSKDGRPSKQKTTSIDPQEGVPFSQIAKDKEKVAEAKRQVSLLTASMRKKLFEPKTQEPPKKNELFVKGTGNKKKKDPKPVDPAYMVNGVVYKRPRLPRPQHWVTDRLYKYIWKKIEPKYGMSTRVRSEKFVLNLCAVVKKATRLTVYKNYELDLEDLMRDMARLGLIVHRKDFNDFCVEFLPYSFRVKATPIMLPGNKMSIPYDPNKLYTPLVGG